MTATARPRTTRETLWPVGIGNHRGWPMPDGAWDDDCSVSSRGPGWLPWAVWQREPGWYVAFYTCSHGHAWTCGHGSVARRAELVAFPVSPFRTLPSDGYLRRHVGEPGEIRLQIIDWRPRK